MNITFNFSDKPSGAYDSAILCVYNEGRLSAAGERLDKELGGFISDHLKCHKSFSGKLGQTLTLAAPKDSAYHHVILLGFGDAKTIGTVCNETAGGNLYAALKVASAEKAVLFLDEESTLEKIDTVGRAVHIAGGLGLRAYSFNQYKTEKNDDDAAAFSALTIILKDAKKAEKEFAAMQASVAGTYLARDLMNEPPNILYPESFAKRIKDELKPLGVKVEILDHKKMEKLGMGAALAVGKGSERPPCMVVMHWDGTDGKSKEAPPLGFVGKGVTFDTGGISIKPSASMDEMKMDMGGAACVSGLMKTLALRKAKANVVGVIGLAENMPSHNAYRPGDVVTSMSGKTIEVLNTDAEGRLVLADALTYIQKTYDPSFIVDLATLTGAIIVALGMEYSGAFVNDDDFWAEMLQSSKMTGEKIWRMPLDEAYRKQMDGNIADLNNLGNEGRWGGSCTAAAFLERFIDEDRKWAHLDIAGTMSWKKDKPTVPKGPVGFGVRLLNHLISDHYEA